MMKTTRLFFFVTDFRILTLDYSAAVYKTHKNALGAFGVPTYVESHTRRQPFYVIQKYSLARHIILNHGTTMRNDDVMGTGAPPTVGTAL